MSTFPSWTVSLSKTSIWNNTRDFLILCNLMPFASYKISLWTIPSTLRMVWSVETHIMCMGFPLNLKWTHHYFFSIISLVSSRSWSIDDIIITRNNKKILDRFITKLNVTFSLKDLGSLIFFLRHWGSFYKDGMHLYQAKYINNLFVIGKYARPQTKVLLPLAFLFNLHGATICNSFHMFSCIKIHRSSKIPYHIGLKSFIVSKHSQSMYQPTDLHRSACKRVLRYL